MRTKSMKAMENGYGQDSRIPRTRGHPLTTAQQSVAPVVLMMSSQLHPRIALLRADEVASRLEAPLYIVVCLPDERHINMLFPQKTAVEDAARIQLESATHQRVWKWSRSTISMPIELERIVIRRGHLTACALEIAHMMKPQLIVISESDINHGREATYIAENTGVPVMISRIRRPKKEIIAATDMNADGFPVVRKGALYAQALGAPLTIIHNVLPQATMPVSLAVAADGSIFYPVLSEKELAHLLQQRKTDLDALAAEIGKTEVEVSRNDDIITAVLDLAKSHQADMIVVGHRRRSWIGRALNDAVAPRVIDRSTRSIMVVPLNS